MLNHWKSHQTASADSKHVFVITFMVNIHENTSANVFAKRNEIFHSRSKIYEKYAEKMEWKS